MKLVLFVSLAAVISLTAAGDFVGLADRHWLSTYDARYWLSEANTLCSDKGAISVTDRDECKRIMPFVRQLYPRAKANIARKYSSSSSPTGCFLSMTGGIGGGSIKVNFNSHETGGRSIYSRDICKSNDQGTCKGDVGFLMDSSGSVHNHWDEEKTFVKKLAHALDISPEGSHAAATIFADEFPAIPPHVKGHPGAELKIKFSEHTNVNTFEKAIDALPYWSGYTRIENALKVGLNEMFQESNGMRPDPPKTLVLITDGQNHGVDYAAWGASFRNAKIRVIAIGVGKVNEADLTALVGARGDLHLAKDFDALLQDSFIKNITLCNACEAKPKDVGYVMDVSGSVGRHWSTEQKFVKTLSQAIKFAPAGSHSAVTIFSSKSNGHSDAELMIKFSDYTKLAAFEGAVDSLPYWGGLTRIDSGVEVALNEMFQESNGMRPDAPKVLVLITDGVQTVNPPNKTNAEYATLLQNANIRTIVIGVGSVDSASLLELVAAPSDFHLAKDFNELLSDEFITSITTCDD